MGKIYYDQWKENVEELPIANNLITYFKKVLLIEVWNLIGCYR